MIKKDKRPKKVGAEGVSPSKKPKFDKKSDTTTTKKPLKNDNSTKTDKTPKSDVTEKPGGKFEKKGGTNIKGKKGKVQILGEKPEDWNEFKKQKKELKLKRKKTNTLYEVIVQTKKMGEKLRMKNFEGGKEARSTLVKEVHDLMKVNYVKFVLAHDMARIVQYLLKFGPENIRQEISKEIIPSTVIMLQSKYGKFCVKPMLKYGNAATRAACIRATYGHAVKLTSHALSSPVFEYAYSSWATVEDRNSLAQEFYGDMYKQSKDVKIKHLRDVWGDAEEMKAGALSATKANLMRVINKGLLDSGLVQTVLSHYLDVCVAEERAEMIGLVAPHSVVVGNSKDGARVVMQCIWHGTNKDRKVAMKAIKEHVAEIACHEHGHTVLIALLDSADDTVLLNKIILAELVSKAQEMIKDEHGRKVLLWLVNAGNTAHFHPTFIKEIEAGRTGSNCKKDPEIRRKELLGYSSTVLLGHIEKSPEIWLGNSSVAVVTLAIIKTATGESLQTTLDSIAKLIISTEWKITENETETLGIEHTGLHMTLKKLAQNDKKLQESNSYTFGEAVSKSITSDTVNLWISYNRGCFLLVTILENSAENIQDAIKAVVKKHQKVIKQQTTTGAKILLKKLE